MSEVQRAIAREVANKHLVAGDALGWFEELYAKASENASIIPWADMRPNPSLVQWLDTRQISGAGRAALIVGCGLGDDAEELARRGFCTTAFDISKSVITWCNNRFRQSAVFYQVANLLQPPSDWQRKFDLVLESYTLQVLPRITRQQAIECVASLVAPHGTLLVITRGREPNDPEGNMPWPLTKDELSCLWTFGLKEESFEDYFDNENPPVRRFRVTYRRKEK